MPVIHRTPVAPGMAEAEEVVAVVEAVEAEGGSREAAARLVVSAAAAAVPVMAEAGAEGEVVAAGACPARNAADP